MNTNKYFEWAKHYDPDFLEMDFLLRRGIDFSGKKVLEIGCGTGRFTQRIAPFAVEILGIDPDESAVEICKQHLQRSNVTIHTGTLETLTLTENYYDYVVFSWSMYMINEKEMTLRLAYDALNSDGKLIVLQANSGEFEVEVSKLYSHYSSLGAYEDTNCILSSIITNVFGNVSAENLITHFVFDNIDQVIELSTFFIEDEEGASPTEQSLKNFRDALKIYCTADSKIKMTDIVSVFIANK